MGSSLGVVRRWVLSLESLGSAIDVVTFLPRYHENDEGGEVLC